MEPQVTAHFADLIALAQAALTQVEYSTDITPDRAILRLHARYGRRYRVFATELFSEGIRKYSYYALVDDRVEAGFDNSPDPRALHLKYDRSTKEHLGEHIPHLHQDDKTRLSLTEEMTFTDFINWLQSNVTASSS